MAIGKWSKPEGSSSLLLLNPKYSKVPLVIPNQKGITKFRPIPRPYPDYIVQNSKHFLIKAKEMQKKEGGKQSVLMKSSFLTNLEDAIAEDSAINDLPSPFIGDRVVDMARFCRHALLIGKMPKVELWRHSISSDDIGTWALVAYTVSYWGNDKSKIQALDHQKPDPKIPGARDIEKGVFQTTYEAIKAGLDTGLTGLKNLMYEYGVNNHGVKYAERTCLIQGLVYEHNGKTPDKPVPSVIALKPSQVTALESVWNFMPSKTDDFISGFEVGNILDPETGPMLFVYDGNSMSGRSNVDDVFSSPGRSKGGKVQYVAKLSGKVALSDAQAAKLFIEWNDLINVMDRRQAWEQVLRCIGPIGAAYAGAVAGEIESLPKEIQAKARKYAQGQFDFPTNSAPAMAGSVIDLDDEPFSAKPPQASSDDFAAFLEDDEPKAAAKEEPVAEEEDLDALLGNTEEEEDAPFDTAEESDESPFGDDDDDDDLDVSDLLDEARAGTKLPVPPSL